MRGLPHYPVPDLATCLEANLQAARLTSPDVIAVGVAVNTSNLGGADAAARACAGIEDALGLPCQDPVTMGMARIADRLQSCFASLARAIAAGRWPHRSATRAESSIPPDRKSVGQGNRG